MSKIIFNRETLLSRLKKCSPFIPKKAIIAAHEVFLFKLRDGVAAITAQDGEKQITVWCNAEEYNGDIMFCIPARLLISTLDLMLDETVQFTKKELKAAKPEDMGKCIVEVKSGKSKYNLQSDDGSAYPFMPTITSNFEASFTGAAFNTAIETALSFADSQAESTFKQGVCMRLFNNSLNAYATTGFEIVKVVMAPRSINQWDDIIIPVNSSKAIVDSVNDGDIVDVIHNKDRIEVKTSDCSIMALAFNIKYPNIEEFYKKKPEDSIRLNTVQFLSAVKRIKGFTKIDSDAIKMRIETTQLSITVDNDHYARDGQEIIDVMAKLELLIGLDAGFLAHTVSNLKSDEFDMFYSDPSGLVYFEPVIPTGDNGKHFIIAPIKLNN